MQEPITNAELLITKYKLPIINYAWEGKMQYIHINSSLVIRNLQLISKFPPRHRFAKINHPSRKYFYHSLCLL